MVAVVNMSKSISNALHYNEHKTTVLINEEKKIYAAQLIHSSGYAKDTEMLSFTDKLQTLQKQAALRDSVKVNSIHISLNFDLSEKDMPVEKLRQITGAYMEKIGFGNQPYLVYKHNDAGHPHVHIVTTNIKSDGKAINLNNIGRDKSEPARLSIEKEFNLVEAQSHDVKEAFEIKPVNTQKILYGKSATKRAVTNVLDHVISKYMFTSVAELNAVLSQYNVLADRGQENGRIYRTGGLTYRAIDEKGNKIGKPIKASSIYNKPTLVFLEEKFKQNEPLRLKHKNRLKTSLDLVLANGRMQSLDEFKKALEKENITPVFRLNTAGLLYGVTYIDRKNKTVFNGNTVGKQYSANAIRQRFVLTTATQAPESQAIKQPGIIPAAQAPERQMAAHKEQQATHQLPQPAGTIGKQRRMIAPEKFRLESAVQMPHYPAAPLNTGNFLRIMSEILLKEEYSGTPQADYYIKRKRKRKRIHI